MRAILLLALALGACSTTVQGVGCPRLSHWSTEDQKALAVEYGTAAPIVRRAVDDLKYMRDQSRACAGT